LFVFLLIILTFENVFKEAYHPSNFRQRLTLVLCRKAPP